MTRLILLYFFLTVNSLCSKCQTPTETGVAIRNVTVITMDGMKILKNQTVLLKNGKIYKIIPSTSGQSIPKGFRIIEGKGLTVLPGLSDMHVHLRRASYNGMLSYLNLGVTTIREMNGRPFLLRWKDSINRALMVGPRLYVASPSIGNWSSAREGYPTPKNSKQTDSLIQAHKVAGYDYIKVHNFIKDSIYDFINHSAQRYTIKVVGHVPVEISLQKVINAHQLSIEHFTGYTDCCMTAESKRLDSADYRGIIHAVLLDKDSLDRYVNMTIANKIWNVPTLTFFDRVLPAPQVEKAFGDPNLRKLGMSTRQKLLMALHKKNALIMFGTDSDAGEDLAATTIYDEMYYMHQAGMTNYDILKIATVMPAIFLGLESQRGRIKPGMDADLLIVKGDPIKNIEELKNVKYVIVAGKIVVQK